MNFYNIQINFFSVYASFYIFMAICIYMFYEKNTTDSTGIEGMLIEINNKYGKTIKKSFLSDDDKSLEMETVAQ